MKNLPSMNSSTNLPISAPAPSNPIFPPPRCILYAEDEDDDVFFFKSAMKVIGSSCLLHNVPDGQKAIDYLSNKGTFADRSRFSFPALVILDINMPKKTGLQVLQWIREQPNSKSLPVVMLTSSSRPEDMDFARQFGADDYLLKPSDPKKLVDIVKALHARWISTTPPPIASALTAPASQTPRHWTKSCQNPGRTAF